MLVELLHHTPLTITDRAISKCWNKPYDKDNVNYEKIERVGNKFKHASTLEHISYNFDIDGVSRALLQELARHRMSSFSVKSSRYTLKELKDAPIDKLKDFIVRTDNDIIDNSAYQSLVDIVRALNKGVANDIIKYALPESYKTSLIWTINARSLQNFISLRTSKSALWEIRDLANMIFENLPEDHKFLFKDFIDE